MAKQQGGNLPKNIQDLINQGQEIQDTPESLSAFGVNQEFEALTSEAKGSSMTSDEYESYGDQGLTISPYFNNEKRRSEAQGWGEEALNGLGRIAAKLPATVVQNFASLADLSTIATPNPELVSNSIYDAMEEYKQMIDEELPIYRENPGESFSMGDSAWWIDNIAGVTESAAAFVITSYLTGGVLGKAFTAAARGGRIASLGLKGKDLAVATRMSRVINPTLSGITQGAGTFTNALLTNHMEGFGVGLQTAKTSKELALAQGKTVEEANKLAGEAATLAYNTNRYNIAFNLTSAGAFLTSPRHTRQLLKQMTAKNTLNKLGIEAVQEGIEEEVNHIAQKRGEAHATGKKYGMSEALNDALTEEGLETAFWGAMGGIGQTALTGATNNLPTQRDSDGNRTSKLAVNNKKWVEQQEVIKQYEEIAKMHNIPSALSAFKNTVEMGKLLDGIEEASTAGDEDTMNLLKNQLVDVQAFSAFEDGTTAELIKMYEDIRDGEATEGLETNEKSDNYYKKKAQKAIDKVVDLEKEYLKSSQYVNGRDVFTNRANKENLLELKPIKEQVKMDKQTELTAEIYKQQEAGKIPKAFRSQSLALEVDDKVPGVEIKGETLNSIDIPITIDPLTNEAVSDPMIPQEVTDAVTQQVKGLSQFVDYNEASNDAKSIDSRVEALDQRHEFLTSDPVQLALIEQESAQEEAIANVKEAEEAKVKKQDKKIQRIQSKDKGQVTAPVDQIAESTESVTEVGLGDFITGDSTETSKEESMNSFMGLSDTVDEEKKEVTAKVLNTEADKDIETASVEREVEEDKQEVYTVETNEVVDAVVEELTSSPVVDKAHQVIDQDNEPKYIGHKVSYAPSALAYLAKDYKTVTSTKDGKITVRKQDIDNELMTGLDLDLVTSTFEQSPLEMRLLDDDSIEMMDPRLGVLSTWGAVKSVIGDDIDYAPIGVFIPGKPSPSAYIHGMDWINDANVDSTNTPLDEQRADLRRLRKEIRANNGSIKTFVTSKSNGNLITTHDGEVNTVKDVLTDPKLKFGIVDSGELVPGKPNDGAFDNMEIVNKEIIEEYSGMLFAMVPMGGIQAGEEGNYVAVPVKRKKLKAEYAKTVVEAVRLWHKSITSKLDASDKLTLDKLDNFFPENYKGTTGLETYIKNFVHGQSIQNKSDLLDKAIGLDSSAHLLGFDIGDSISWTRGGDSKLGRTEGSILSIDKSTPAKEVESLLTNLESHLKGMHTNANFTNEQEGEFIVPIINGGEVTFTEGTYKDFIKENTETSLLSFNDGEGKYVYTIQHVIDVDMNKPFESNVSEEVITRSEEEENTELPTLLSGGDEITLDLDFTDADLSDDLGGMDVFNDVEDKLRKEFLIDGLTAGEHDSIVNFIAYHINKSVIAKHQIGETTGKNAQLKGLKAFFDKTLAKAETDGKVEGAVAVRKVVDNWGEISKFVEKELVRMKTITVKGDLSLKDLAEGGADLSKKSYEDDNTLMIDGKKSISSKLKRFMSAIPQTKADGSKAKGWLGLPLVVEFDTAYNTIIGELAGSKPSFDQQMQLLKKAAVGQPWLLGAVASLEEADSSTKAEFASAMSKHYVNMQAVIWSADANGSYSMEVAPVNANAVGRSIQGQWANDIQNSTFVTDPTDPNEYVVNENKAQNLIKQYANLDKSDPDLAFDWLLETGIEISPKTKEHLVNSGMRYANRDKSFKQLYAKGGLFNNINEALKDHIKNGTSLTNGDLASNSAIRALSIIEATYNPTYFSNSHKNGEGKTIYSYAANKYLINRVRDLKTDKGLIDGLSKIPFSMHSKWAKELKKKQDGKASYFAENFEAFYFDTLGQKDKSGRGVIASRMTTAEHEIMRIGLFQNRGNGTKTERQAKVLYPTTSDKKVPFGFTITAHDTKVLRDGSIGEETIQAVYESTVLPEIERILAWQRNKGKFNVKSYEKGAGLFLFMPELNTADIFDDNGELDSNILSTDENGNGKRDIIKQVVRSYINEAVSQKMEDWSDLGIGEKGAFLDKDYMRKVARDTHHAAADFTINSIIANAEFFQLMIGDPAVFYKSKVNVKVDGKFNRDPEMTSAYEKISADTFENIGKRLAGDIAPGTELALFSDSAKDTMYKQAFLEDKETSSLAYSYLEKVLGSDASPYLRIEGTDAQEFTTLAEHLFVMRGLGKISTDKMNEINKRAKKDGDSFVLTPEELGTVTQPMKPVYVDNSIEYVEGVPAVDTRIYVKSSSFPLIPQFTKGTGLDSLRKAMENKGIARAAYGTATKVGMSVNAVDPWTQGSDNMIIDEDSLLASTKTLKRSGFRIQQEVPFKEDKAVVKDGTQQRKLLFSNILGVSGFKFKGETLDGTALQEKYNNLYKQLFDNAHETFKKEVYKKDGSLNMEVFRNKLVKEAETQGYPINDILALELDDKGNFVLPLWSSMSANKFEALINGFMDSSLRQQYVRGNSFVLGSQDGMSNVREESDMTDGEKNGVVYTSAYDPKIGLQAIDKDGYAQVMISNKIRDKDGSLIDLTKYVGEDGKIDDSKLPNEVLEMFAYRIPTQGLNSMSKIRVVGFLPDVMGDLAIAPREWTIQMGSDFDVDKIFMTMHNTYVSGGVVKKAEHDREGIENDILDIHLSVLGYQTTGKHNEVQAQMYNPLGFGWLKEGTTADISTDRLNLAESISQMKDVSKGKFNPLSPTYQRTKYINATAGKAGVSVFSLDSTLNAAMQRKDIHISGASFEGVTFGDDVSNGDLSGEHTLRSKRKGESKRFRSDVIAAYQSAAVDNEKEQILDKLNINGSTFDAIRALNQLGFEEDVVAGFINQPSIVEYVKVLARLKDSTSGYVANAEGTALDTIVDKYSKMMDTSWDELSTDEQAVYHKATDRGYEWMSQQISERNPNGYVQIAYLQKFLSISSIGNSLKNLQSAINTDSSGVSPSMFENIAKETKILKLGDANSNLNIVNKESLIGEYSPIATKDSITRSYTDENGTEVVHIKPTTISGYAATTALMTANDIMGRFFPYDMNHTAVGRMFNDIKRLTPVKEESTTREAEKLQKIWKEFRKYLNSNAFTDTPKTERDRLFFDKDGNRSLATKVKEVKAMKRFSKNAFIQRLTSVIQDGSKPSIVRYNASAAENNVENRIYAGFIDLVRTETVLEDNYTTRDLADDLVKAAFIEGGLQEASQYVKYIPMSYLTKGGFAEKMKDINWQDSSILGEAGSAFWEVTNFTKQYYQHNPKEAGVLEKDDIKKGKAGADIIEITEKAVNKYGVVSDDGLLPPVFVSIPNKNSHKKYDIYQLDPTYKGEIINTYSKISPLGTNGMSEYSMKEDNISSITTNKVKPKIGISQMTENDFFAKFKVVPEVSRRPNTQKAMPYDKYGMTPESSDLGIALSTIAASSDSQLNTHLADEYSKMLGNISDYEFRLANPGELGTSRGRTVYGDAIIVNPDYATGDNMEHTILHEVTHALTFEAMNKDSAEVRNLTTMKDIFKRELQAGKYTLSDAQSKITNYLFKERNESTRQRSELQEFTAFAMSNPDFQKLLKQTPYRNENITFWDKLLKGFGKLLKAMGVSDPNNMLAATINDVMTMVEVKESSKVVEKEQSMNSFLGLDSLEDIFNELEREGVLEEGEMNSQEVFVSLSPLVEAGLISGTKDSIKETLTKLKNCK